jgi:hypothetical protein
MFPFAGRGLAPLAYQAGQTGRPHCGLVRQAPTFVEEQSDAGPLVQFGEQRLSGVEI